MIGAQSEEEILTTFDWLQATVNKVTPMWDVVAHLVVG